MKRVMTIQDISCVGKCSLTVALPVISAMGVETAVIPTAVLSTHTAFSDFTFHDLTEDLPEIEMAWEKQGFSFDAIYTGYLGSLKQMDLVESIIDRFRRDDNLVVIDPAMADNGSLYTGFTQEFADRMAELAAKADVIVPNLTEAAFMLGIPYPEQVTEEEIRQILVDLAARGSKKVILTGYSSSDETLGAVCYDSETDHFFSYEGKKYDQMFHGTGDLFASTLVGALTRDFTLEEAVRLAVDVVSESIRCTIEDPDHVWYGVNFEQALPFLIGELNKRK